MCIVSALIDQALRRAYQLPVVGFEPPTQAMIPPQCYRCRFIQWPRQLYETLVWSHHPSMSEHVPGSSGATEPMPKARKKCPHGKQRFRCRECKGGGVCKHGKDKSRCKVCDGNAICRHGKRRARCIPCGGGDICIHKKMRGVCPTCNPSGYCAKLCRNRVYAALVLRHGISKESHTMEYVGCTNGELKEYIESLFEEDMSWENAGSWHIDHIRPCASFDLTLESERHKCFHYKNLQPLWATANLRKGAKWDG